MSKRYIDADALLEALPDDLPYKGSVKRVLIQAPTADVVEVVRCRECKYCHQVIRPNLEHYECGRYGWSGEVVDYVNPTHYCSHGERKEK